jgi:hypothetical protein
MPGRKSATSQFRQPLSAVATMFYSARGVIALVEADDHTG